MYIISCLTKYSYEIKFNIYIQYKQNIGLLTVKVLNCESIRIGSNVNTALKLTP